MQVNEKPDIVIVGGGTSGWMTAAALAKVLQGRYRITLVESDEIGTIGVGEATIPMISLFNRLLELDENEFMRQTQGSFKLGIEFVNWARLGDRYIHGFGVIGQENATVDFYQYWLKQHLAGKAKDLDHYSINTAACLQNKFMRPRLDVPNSPLSQIAYAFHFDASLYARFLRGFSEARGVTRVEGRVIDVTLREGDGHVASLTLHSGRKVEGDLFIDCSGFRALLIEQRAEDRLRGLVALAAVRPGRRRPLRFDQGALPLHARPPRARRAGSGASRCSTASATATCSRASYMSEDEATAILLGNLDGAPLAEPRPIRFVTGKRKKAWNRTWCRSAWPAASSSRSNPPASTWCRWASRTCSPSSRRRASMPRTGSSTTA